MDNSYAKTPEAQQRDLAIIKQRFYETRLRKLPDLLLVEKYLAEMQPDGSYAGLDYDARPKLFLPSFPHLERLGALAMAYRHPESPFYERAEVREKLGRGLDHWLKKDPQTEHIWFLVIGIPLRLSTVLVLLDEELTPEQRTRGIVMLKRGYRESDGAYMYEENPGTGTNLVWVARCQVEAGCLEGNYDFAFRAARAIAHEIRIGTDEGIQPDFSFHQHGPMLYIAGYGMAFGSDCAVMAGIAHGTSLAFPPDKLEILSRYMLDSQQGSVRGRFWDFNIMARNLSFPHGQLAEELVVGVDSIRIAYPARATEAAKFSLRLRGEAPPETGAPVGNQHYWRSDYMVHRRCGYIAGVKMVSNRILGTESGNGQGVKNYYTADGAMSLLKTGSEYARIMAVWNWRQVPGITCAQSDEPFKLVTWGHGAEGKTSFVGGVSDGEYGAASFDFDHDGVRARKAWFFFDDEIVCLGAGIAGEGIHPVTTTLEQNWKAGDVSARTDAGILSVTPGQTRKLNGAPWLLHGTTGYFFPEKQEVVAQVEKRTGAWQSICNDLASDLVETGEVFSAWIDHGVAPQGGNYNYVVLPETSAEKMDAYVAPQILANTPGQQAVWHPTLGLATAVFYQAGEIVLSDGVRLSVDQPCLVLVRWLESSATISVADPAHVVARVEVTWSKHQAGPLIFDLPTSREFAGQTITRTISF